MVMGSGADGWISATSRVADARKSAALVLYTGGARALLPDGTVVEVIDSRNAGPTGLQVRTGRRIGTGRRASWYNSGGLRPRALPQRQMGVR